MGRYTQRNDNNMKISIQVKYPLINYAHYSSDYLTN